MSRNTSKKADVGGKGNPMLVGLLVGLIVGVGLAAGLAWYLMRSPSPFVNKDQAPTSKAQSMEQTRAAASEVVKQSPADASSVSDGKPRFEFYKVLTDKQDAALPGQNGKTPVPKPAEAVKPVVEAAKPAIATVKQTYYLQVGAFADQAEAEKLKANLIFDGMEVSVLSVNEPDKGLLHKVRVGPYSSAEEMNSARAKLKQKGIASMPARGQ